LDAIEREKGQHLRQLDKALGMNLFDLLKDPKRAQDLPLLQLTEQEIITRADKDPQWINALSLIQLSGPGSLVSSAPAQGN
jgi:hypothetical protein